MSATNDRLVAVVRVDAQPLSGYRKRQGVAGRRDAVPCRAPDADDDFRLVHGWSPIVPDSREVYASGPALVRPLSPRSPAHIVDRSRRLKMSPSATHRPAGTPPHTSQFPPRPNPPPRAGSGPL